MQTNTLIDTIDTHTAGEPTRIVTSGIDRSKIRGGSVADQRDRFADTHDWMRELLLCEPRGHDDMFGAVPTEPESDAADLGLFFMDSRGYLDMCGHGTIGAVTALIETGQLSPAESVVVETPAGLVHTEPRVVGGRVDDVSIANVDSFVFDRVTVTVDHEETPHPIAVDVVFAGNVFALVEASEIGLPVDREHVDTFIEIGLAVRRAVNTATEIVHPVTGEHQEVSIVEWYEPSAEADRNVVVFGNGQVDRSPCGTGTCAKMTLLHHEDELPVDEEYEYESIIETRFTGRLRDATERDGLTVTTPEVTGSAYITGRHTFVRDDRDDLDGFSLSSSSETKQRSATTQQRFAGTQ